MGGRRIERRVGGVFGLRLGRAGLRGVGLGTTVELGLQGGFFVGIEGFLWLWSGGIGDAGGLVGVDGREGAELEAVDIGEDGGAARGDVVVGEKYVEVAEGVVDALGGLEALVVGEEGGLEIESIGFQHLPGVHVAEKLARGFNGKLATAARGRAVLAAGGIKDGIGVGGLGFHFFFLHGEVGIPHPRCFLQEWQTKRLCVTKRIRVTNAGLKVVGFSVSCGELVRVARKGLG
jgi:hypothetical protein